MREIKFRAWDNDERKWFTEWENPNRSEWTPDDGHIELSITSGDGSVTLEQFTGLLDKNGKEIYEGDIVRAWIDYGPGGEGQHIYAVEITPHGTSLQPWTFGEPGYLPEVIGNIHEDPELLNA